MHHLDLVSKKKWNTILATNPMDPDVVEAQEFVMGASILVRKWHDRVDHYDNFHQ
jgi:hypothetical protein